MARQLLTATGGNPRESATETTPPLPKGVGKGETSEVRAHSSCRRLREEVNPACCKETAIRAACYAVVGPLDLIGNNKAR
jgi:hypothetical protein